MRRIGISLALVFVAGCAYPPSKVDLLYGPQLIPPPSTASTAGNPTPGSTQQPPPGSYYDQTPGGTGTGGAGTGGTGTGGTGTGTGSGGSTPDRYAPADGSLDYQGSTSRSGSSAFQPVSNGGTAGTAADPFSTSNTQRYSNSAPASATPQPRTFPDDGRVQPRGNVPGTSGQTTPNATGNRYNNGDVVPDDQASVTPGLFIPPSEANRLTGNSVQPVSYSRQVSEPTNANNANSSAGGRGNYDYDSKYSWLRGQLDYSQSERRWKLRYIPITGETDDFGGSVILSGQGLDNFRSGEFVTVQGQLDQQEVERGGFAPLFHVQKISKTD